MQKKVIITGINGFAGRFLREELNRSGYEVYGIDIAGQPASYLRILDLLSDTDELYYMIGELQPAYIFHLAGQASVRESWKIPLETFHSNVDSAVHILDAVHKTSPQTRIIAVGSAEQYGIVRPEDCPIKEDACFTPASPYAISKRAQEDIIRCLAKAKNVDVVFTRTFNHIGPGQKLGFVVPDIASRIAQIKKGNAKVLHVGNLQAERDFSDVRDSVRAYRLLAEKGEKWESYNVGSGKAHSIEWILMALLQMAGINPEIKTSDENLRPIDMPILVADCTKIFADTGYQTEIDIKQTLQDVYAYVLGEGK